MHTHHNVLHTSCKAQTKLKLKKTAIALALAASFTNVNSAYAETTPSNQTAKQEYNIASGPLGKTLSEFAANSGLALSFDPELTQKLTSKTVSGQFTPQMALKAMLEGSGLQIVDQQDGSFTLIKMQLEEKVSALTLAEVKVSGEKIQRRLDKTMSSVAVTTSDVMQQHADHDLQDVMARTPGVYVNPGNENWGIRGVPVSGFDSQGAGTMNGAVTVFVDGAPQTHRLITLNPLSLWDVEQVEIFRGAQSTTQGRNSLAGAIVLETKAPTFKPEFAAQTNFGQYGEKGVSLMANGGLVDDVIAGRLALDYQTDDGFVHNETLDIDGDQKHSLNARGKLLIQPTDQLDVLLTFNRTEHKRGTDTVNAINGKPQYYKQFLNTEEESELDQNSAVAKLDYYLSDDWTLTNISTGTWADYQSVLDFDQRVDLEREVSRQHKQRLLTEELRLGYEGDTLKGFLGVYYGTHTNDINDQLSLNLAGINDPAYIANGDVRIRNMALFGETNWEFIEEWTLVTGLRYDHEKNKTKFNYIDPLGFATVKKAELDTSFNALLPKVGISHNLTENQLIGLEWKRGYRGGGIDLSTSTAHEPYDPEYTSTYEMSWRGSWANKKVSTSLNVYHTDWKDQQVEIADANGITFVSNAAEARMQGLELAMNVQPTSNLNLFLGTSYNHTEYVDFTLDGQNLDGEPFPFAPEYKVTLGGNYTFANGLKVGSDVIYQSDSTTIAYESGIPVRRDNDNVTLVNLNLAYQVSKNLSVSAYVRNLFDREYITTNFNDTSMDVGAPRTAGISIRASM